VLSDILVLIAVIKLGYVLSVMFVLAFNDMTHKFDDLFGKRCVWCGDKVDPQNPYDLCSGRCADLYYEGGTYVG
jgi:hypothetical protein